MKRKSFGRDAGLSLRMLLTSGLLGLLYVLFAVVLFQFTGVGWIGMLVIIAAIAFFQYFTSDKLALAAAGAKVVERDQAPELHDMFATGRSPQHAAVAVTTGLWRRLEPQEVEAVLAHELSHIANRDVLIMTVASFFAMCAAMLTRISMYSGMLGGRGRDSNGPPIWLIVLVVSVVTYALSYVLIRTISRYREYAADRGSALITGAPEHLMSALQRISSNIMQIPDRDLREVAGMNAFFIVPTSIKRRTAELFMDHPPLEKRLAALEKIAREMGRAA
jgi:heat shock protein HtpX